MRGTWSGSNWAYSNEDEAWPEPDREKSTGDPDEDDTPPEREIPDVLRDPEAFWKTVANGFKQRAASRQALPELEPLKQVRKHRRMSQFEVAARMGCEQTDISRMERRPDLRISTLSSYISALGGSLDLSARFPGLVVRIKLGAP